jgi:hypothetical protein
MTVVDPGGEIVALDAAGYGAVTVDKSVSIIANPGVYAGITASGVAITIDTPSVNVLVRGLSIAVAVGQRHGHLHAPGGQPHGRELHDQRLPGGHPGRCASDGESLRLLDPRQQHRDLRLQRDARREQVGAPAQLWFGVWSKLLANGGSVAIAISDSVLVGNGFQGGLGGAAVLSDDDGYSGTQKMSITRSTLSQNRTGARAARVFSTASVTMTVTGSTVTGNLTGFRQEGGAVFESMGNNTVRQNDANTTGTITPVGTM